MSGKKRCTKCRKIKPWSSFYAKKHRSHTRNHGRPVCKACYKIDSDAYYRKHHVAVKARQLKSRQKLKLEVITAYGGKCSCCPEGEIKFLTIEHVNKDGKAHRAAFPGGMGVYRDIRSRGFPPEYTIHCFNCNIAKSLFGVCPHQQLRYTKPVDRRRCGVN